MFGIDSIFAGWFYFNIDELENNYSLSYLDCVKEELDDLFNLDIQEGKYKVFDMESFGDLWVTAYRQYDTLNLVFTKIHAEEEISQLYRLDYDKFVKSYIESMEQYKDVYIKEFAYHQDDFVWDTEEYQQLKAKLSKD